MTAKYTCIIADDNELDRLMLTHLINKHSNFEIIGAYNSAEAVLDKHTNNLPHILFLDIDMGEKNGLQLRELLIDVPVCVFVTSYADYAVDSFELNALDFIVKPIQKERFEKTIHRINEYMTLKEKAGLLDEHLGGDYIFIKEGTSKIKISTHEIRYLEAYKDYTKIVSNNAYHIILSSLGNLLQQPPFDKFIRIHRSYAVARHHVQQVHSNEVSLGNINLPIGRSYKDILTW